MGKQRLFLSIASISLFIFSNFVFQNANAITTYGATLCHSAGFTCYKVKPGDTWAKIAPDPKERDILQRINRMNINPYSGTFIAMPNDLSDATIYDFSPFPRYITPPGTRTIYVSQQQLAWGAYDPQGNLIWWGPISPGRSFCADIKKPCTTPNGSYYIQWKEGIDCTSSQFPVRNEHGGRGGAPMPYCMHFWGGYALHGSTTVPGYADSHGCVRMFTQDARWLNQNFIQVPQKGQLGTHVVVSEGVI
jgi:hypothetical protein